MHRFRLTRIGRRVLFTSLTAVMMGLIFFFSSQSAEKSDATSSVISEPIIYFIYHDYELYPAEKKNEIYNHVQHIVRKTAHFSEYMILAVLMNLCMESWFGRHRYINPASLSCAVLYACTDEMHQMLTEGRSAVWSDVMIDSAGAVLGLMLLHAICRVKNKKEGSK